MSADSPTNERQESNAAVARLPAAEADALAERLERVRANIAAAALRAGRRPEEITLVGAVKAVEPAAICAAAELGLTDFGENYVQEAAAKRAALGSRLPAGARWHLLGHLQTNKVKAALDLFDIIQTVDSLRLADAINRRSLGPAVPVLLEVKFGPEPERSGFRPEELRDAAAALRGSTGLLVQGLMTVAPLGLTAAETRGIFGRLRELREQLAAGAPELEWRHLSMGMSEDYEIAVEEGATMVRIGRAIFGDRPTG